MDVAVLGMGRMGRALAGRMLEGGHQVTVWNRSKGRAGDVVSAGAREARSVADAVVGVDVAITMLANDDAVRAVASGELRSSGCRCRWQAGASAPGSRAWPHRWSAPTTAPSRYGMPAERRTHQQRTQTRLGAPWPGQSSAASRAAPAGSRSTEPASRRRSTCLAAG
jgi:hypothetical protein